MEFCNTRILSKIKFESKLDNGIISSILSLIKFKIDKIIGSNDLM